MTGMKLTREQLQQFDEEGWLLVEDVFDPERDFAPVLADYERIADSLGDRMLAQGTISSYDRTASFAGKMISLAEQTGGFDTQPFDISLPQSSIRSETPMYLGKPAFDILRHERLLDIVEQIIGPEIYSNPVQHIRVKVPENLVVKDEWTMLGRRTPWHQDNAVLTPDADDSEVISVWAPLTEARVEHGCLALLSRSHRDGVKPHCPNPLGIRLAEGVFDVEQLEPVPMRPGDALFFTRTTIHGSLPNTSREIRWSFDLRYNRIGQPTGREYFPGFVARSRSDPDAELRDHEAWATSWIGARDGLAGKPGPRYNRWDIDAPWCA